MADVKTPDMGKRQIPELMKINPLITDNGDTTHVQAVLSFLSFSMMETNASGMAFSSLDLLGLAFIMDTCVTALANMPGCEVHHG